MAEPTTESDARQITHGEQLVGINFNPAADSDVDKLKRLFAEAADLIEKHHNNHPRETHPLENEIYKEATMDILKAQMMCVKLVTWKY